MDKTAVFLNHDRVDAAYRPVAERLRDYRAVELRLTENEVRQQAERCMDCGTPFCHAAGCPLNNVIPELNDMASRGKWEQALNLLLATNNFPEFTGRICPALCEGSCVLSLNGKATAIRQVELAIIENAFELGLMRPRPPLSRDQRKIAVIGSGPAGLAAADVLNQSGFQVTVYDSDLKPGGILRYGIPDFKLEKSVIDRRIELMKAEGICFEMRADIGRDISARYLMSRYNAVCIAGGAREPRDMKVEGRNLGGIHFALDYLIRQNMRCAGELPPGSEEITACGKKVAVIGGGDTGSDCIGTALRQGPRRSASLKYYRNRPRPGPAIIPGPNGRASCAPPAATGRDASASGTHPPSRSAEAIIASAPCSASKWNGSRRKARNSPIPWYCPAPVLKLMLTLS
jgi:glutamate synthase (NADPH/NADH) small chain